MTEIFKDPAFHFIWLEVGDLPTSVDFYRQVLGFPVQDESGTFGVVHLEHGQVYLSPGTPKPFSGYIAIAVPDVERLRQRLLAHGLPVTEVIDEGWAQYINVIDPNGYRLILLQPTTEAG
ncbi:MAG: VOC family protein [Caldilineales bacterium]|nr:VOC family protein [Caldilineales bacterium]